MLALPLLALLPSPRVRGGDTEGGVRALLLGFPDERPARSTGPCVTSAALRPGLPTQVSVALSAKDSPQTRAAHTVPRALSGQRSTPALAWSTAPPGPLAPSLV